MDDTFAVVLNQRTPSHVYHDHRVTVIEKRAPTDESIRLFKELQEKAWDSVVNAFELKTILGSVNVIEYQEMEFLVAALSA